MSDKETAEIEKLRATNRALEQNILGLRRQIDRQGSEIFHLRRDLDLMTQTRDFLLDTLDDAVHAAIEHANPDDVKSIE